MKKAAEKKSKDKKNAKKETDQTTTMSSISDANSVKSFSIST